MKTKFTFTGTGTLEIDKSGRLTVTSDAGEYYNDLRGVEVWETPDGMSHQCIHGRFHRWYDNNQMITVDEYLSKHPNDSCPVVLVK